MKRRFPERELLYIGISGMFHIQLALDVTRPGLVVLRAEAALSWKEGHPISVHPCEVPRVMLAALLVELPGLHLWTESQQY